MGKVSTGQNSASKAAKNNAFKCSECGMEVAVPQIAINYCPNCGVLGAHWQRICNALLLLYEGDGRLKEALRLFRKAVYPDAARAALISLEMEMKRLGRTESHGTRLVDEVLSFEYDKKERKYLREPIVRVNALKSQKDRSEQEGIHMLISGMFKVFRNTLMHQHVRFSPIDALSVVVMSNLLIDILNNGSILNKRVCRWKKVKLSNKQSIDGVERSRLESNIQHISSETGQSQTISRGLRSKTRTRK
ncbi:MAG: hypothetical protein C0402_01495 [Thermodesulfovibrio sp.]|nr:hypothetical protein [Thermodesulfovibrio sp.]